jgi:SNF2 family DNA or RNA helicase
MTRLLDILGDYLNLRKITYSRLDGSMNYTDRQVGSTI